MPVDWGQFADAPAEQPQTAPAPAPVDWGQFADAPAASPVQTPTPVASAAPASTAGGGIDWGQFADDGAGMQTPAAPAVTEIAPVQTSKNSFELGLKAAGDWFNQLPIVQEVKTNPIEQTATNLARGAPYGIAQIADVGNAVIGAVPRGLEIGAHMLGSGLGTGNWGEFDPSIYQTPLTDALFMGAPNSALKYRQEEEKLPGYSPATFKAGGMAAQMALPASSGLQAGSVGAAAGIGALENAVIGGISNAGDQLGETGRIDPGQLAVAVGLGAPLGAAGGALGYGAGKLAGKIGSLFNPKAAEQAAQQVAADAQKAIVTGEGKSARALGLRAPRAGYAPEPEGPQALDHRPTMPKMFAGKVQDYLDLSQTNPWKTFDQVPAEMKGKTFHTNAPAPDGFGMRPTMPRALSNKKQDYLDLTSNRPTFDHRPTMPEMLQGGVNNEEEALFRHRRTAFGRNKADEGTDLSQFPASVQKAAQQVAELKMKLDYQSKALEDYTKQVWDLAESKGLTEGGAFVGPNKAFISKKLEGGLSVHDEADLAKLRESLAVGTSKPTGKQHVSSLLGGRFGGGNKFDMKMPEFKTPDDLAQAMDNLVTLKRTVSATEKAYKAAKEAGKPHFDAAQETLRQSDPQASFNAKTKVLSPLKEEVDAKVSLDHNPMQLKLTKEGREIYEKAKQEKFQQQAKDRNYQPKISFELNTKNVKRVKKALAVAVAFGLGNQGKAKAEDGSFAGEGQEGFDWGTAARLTVQLAALSYAAPKLAAKIINPENAKLSWMFNDTVQRIEALDQKMGTKLAKDIWQHLGQVHADSFGVTIDPDLRQQAMQALRDGETTVFKNLNLTPEQRSALLTYDNIQRNLRGLVDDQIEDVREAIAELSARDQEITSMNLGLDALKEMRLALGRKETNVFEQAYSAGLRKFFDYHFFYNPAFHLTNLSDQVISVAPRVGPMNLLSANKALIGNAKLKKLFENSGLAGGFEGEKLHVGAVGHTPVPKKRFELKDWKSDKVNADRAALAAMFQYRQTHGIAGGDEEFAEKLLDNQLAPDVALDTWAHVAETLSRSLGADPMRVNMDIFAARAPFLSAFVRQPARISNMMIHLLANDPKKFYLVMGGMALAAGNAAIPAETKEIWERVDPKAYFMAAKILDHMEVASYLTGKSLTPKAQWAFFAPLQMTSDPLRSTAGNLIDSTMDSLQQISEGKFTTDKANTLLGNAASVFMPRVAGAPVKQLLGIEKAGEESLKGTKHVSYYSKFGEKYGQPEDVSLDELGISPYKNFFDQFFPGEANAVKTRKLAKEEEYFRKHNLMNPIMDATQGAGSWSVSDGVQKDPLNVLLRAITGTGKKNDEQF